MDLFDLKNWLAGCLSDNGFDVTGSGSSLVTPEADIGFRVDGRNFSLVLRDLDAPDMTPPSIDFDPDDLPDTAPVGRPVVVN